MDLQDQIESLLRAWEEVTGKTSITIPKTGEFAKVADVFVAQWRSNGYSVSDNEHSVSVDWSD